MRTKLCQWASATRVTFSNDSYQLLNKWPRTNLVFPVAPLDFFAMVKMLLFENVIVSPACNARRKLHYRNCTD
ncbi:hypothetical protein MAR_006869 [Mya arenaria]|uniref:Uncharacterized protein n=1 Tax=Mya arenaria TaxID=6604 RepID=A0ABY7DAU4_MYAAR|nr:hypothetical protein MAR_006869 [Mya arenaria]